MEQLRIRTRRMELVAGDREVAEAELNDRPRFFELLCARTGKWPPSPELNDEASMRYTLDFFDQNPHAMGWSVWYYLLSQERVVIGKGGFKGKPDAMGMVEIGYSVLEEYQKQGYASEATRALVGWAFAHPEVTCVLAETLPELKASIRVLEKNGFAFIGPGSEEGVIRYRIERREAGV